MQVATEESGNLSRRCPLGLGATQAGGQNLACCYKTHPVPVPAAWQESSCHLFLLLHRLPTSGTAMLLIHTGCVDPLAPCLMRTKRRMMLPGCSASVGLQASLCAAVAMPAALGPRERCGIFEKAFLLAQLLWATHMPPLSDPFQFQSFWA